MKKQTHYLLYAAPMTAYLFRLPRHIIEYLDRQYGKGKRSHAIRRLIEKDMEKGKPVQLSPR